MVEKLTLVGMNMIQKIRTTGNSQNDPIGINQYGSLLKIFWFYFFQKLFTNEKDLKVFGYHYFTNKPKKITAS